MPIRIESYSSRHLESIRALNQRFRSAGVEEGFFLPERSDVNDPGAPFEALPGLPVVKRHWLLLDGDIVRGGFILQDQQFYLRGRAEWVTNIQMPVTEGLIDRRYAYLAIQMIQAILKRTPLAFAVGMGGMEQPFPRFLAASKWHVSPVPFLFYVLRPARFLRELPMLRSSPTKSMLMDIAAGSGVGSIGIRSMHHFNALRHGGTVRENGPKVRIAGDWDAWVSEVNELWESYRETTSLAAIRDYEHLRLFHPPAKNFEIYGCRQEDRFIGWSAVQITPMHRNKYFGNLRVATILDSVSRPGSEAAVVRSTLATLRARGAELAVVNQTHQGWVQAMRQTGFVDGTSNFSRRACARRWNLSTLSTRWFTSHGPTATEESTFSRVGESYWQGRATAQPI